MTLSRVVALSMATCLLWASAEVALADPHHNQALKFYQMPLNNGATPYLPVPTFPPTPGYGAPSTAFFPGHDELSTATATAYIADPVLGQVPVAWSGTYMADDFADYAGTPIVHVRWWGSYLNQPTTQGGVKKFLISFEHNVPAAIGDNGQVIPSHPAFNHPDNLHQIVDFIGGPAPPPPGRFTEKPIPTPGPVPPPEALFEYNAELHLDKWFYEKAASPNVLDDVYWLKIVALVDPLQDGNLQWGWHNRDWSITDTLAAKPGTTPDGAEHIEGFVPGPGGSVQPVWHFEDDAVLGEIFVTPGMSPVMPNVQQIGFIPQLYRFPVDGPDGIQSLSKDLAFELYTLIPEPASVVLLALAMVGMLGLNCRKR